MKVLIAIIVLSLELTVGNNFAAAAVLPYAATPEEMARLPALCTVRMHGDRQSPEYRAWRARIGENYEDFFHYCAGLNFVNRYWGARVATERNYYLQQAKAEFDYIINRMKPDFTMGADLYSDRGGVFNLMGRLGDAINDFNKALSIDPKMVRPYLELADLYEKAKNRTRALEVTTAGLRLLPDSKALQRRYLELGGKRPFPDPVVQDAPHDAAQPVDTPPAKGEETATTGNPASDAAASTPAVVPPEAAPQPKIGTPNNPYCRFCPD
jgi:tetratricopeptide (TPR) repeat protein